jgi:hypothetical protein
MTQRWLEERREILLWEVLSGFVESLFTFLTIKRRYERTKRPDFSLWAGLLGFEIKKGPLWRLTELSHFLFRRKGAKPSIHEVLFDWSLGAIFHECLKIREDLYQLNHPPDFKKRTKGLDLPEIRSAIEEWERRMASIRISLSTSMEEVERLFRSAWKGLRGTIIANREMGLLMRFIAENYRTFEKLLGQSEWSNFLSEIHEAGEAHIWYRAAVDYMEGGWLEDAKRAARRALKISPSHAEAQRLLASLQTRRKKGQ